ncbi:hypothetical protein [Leptodesmis sichuanensis]|uniref:hypothetical protein n=1 Tax=Leptodesmis sichuanensis TaxID=2906798 RepID=UPI001F1A75CE|nr:hypothetical protein [Leptodesmis sichuanensis]UIE37818.1 hypothetical protein KIK02_23345 [Leptodesmis sichuanensis A121]
MTDSTPGTYAVPQESILEYRYTVYFEGLALWKEKDPQRRATIARQLADWSATLAEMEAEETRKLTEQPTSTNEAA